MSSKIETASNALVRIGVPPISSFTEGGAAGVVANNIYEPTILAILTETRWRFAAAKRLLAKLTSTPLNEWSNAFQLPSDLILMYRVYPNSNYEIYENKLYSNNNSVSIDYLFRPDESRWPAYFQLAVEYKLASEFALTVTNNSTKAKIYEEKYQQQIVKARFADAQGRPATPMQRSNYISVRG